LFALRIFLQCPPELRLERRLERDISERARSREEVLWRFATQVEPMQQRFVEPLRRTADIVLDSPTPPRALLEVERRIGRLALS
jgi:uridine kinase